MSAGKDVLFELGTLMDEWRSLLRVVRVWRVNEYRGCAVRVMWIKASIVQMAIIWCLVL